MKYIYSCGVNIIFLKKIKIHAQVGTRHCVWFTSFGHSGEKLHFY